MNGRLVLAGFDPSQVEFRHVISVAWALLIEVYRQYDVKFYEAMDELKTQLEPESKSRPAQKAPDDGASMAMLQSMMVGSDFKGPKG